MPKANIIAANGGLGDEVDQKPQSKKFLSPGQSPPSRRADAPCHLPLLRGGFFCGRLRPSGRIKPEQCTMVKSSSFRHGKGKGEEVDSFSYLRCSFFFKEKEGTEEKPFWRKTAFFEKGWCGGGGAWSRRIGLYEADPPIECTKRAWRRVGVLFFGRFLSDSEGVEGGRTS